MLSLFKENKSKNINSEDIQTYSKTINREIIIDNITPQVANQVNTMIRTWNLLDEKTSISIANREPIKIYIDSLGGSLAAALTILDSIKISKTPVYTFNIGVAYKEAFLIFLSGHKRYAYPNANFMYSTPDNLKAEAAMNESNFYNYSLLLEKTANEIQNFIIDRTNITESNFEKYGKNDWWFNADDAIKLRICNEIVKEYYFKNKGGK